MSKSEKSKNSIESPVKMMDSPIRRIAFNSFTAGYRRYLNRFGDSAARYLQQVCPDQHYVTQRNIVSNLTASILEKCLLKA